MDDDYEESFKRAVFNKVKRVNHLVNDITIGPNSLKKLSLNASPKTPVRSKTPFKQQEATADSGIPTSQFLKLLDIERQEKVECALNERIGLFQKFSKAQEEQSKQSWLKTQQSFIEDMEKQETYIIEANQQYDQQQSMQHAKMAQLTQNAVQRMKQRQELLKEKEMRRQLLVEHITKIKLNQQKFSSEFQQILSLLKGCVDNGELKNSKELNFNLLKSLPTEIEVVLEKCKGDSVSTITEKDVQTSDEIVARIIEFKNKFKVVVEAINNKKQMQKAAEEEEETRKQEQAVNLPPTAIVNTTEAAKVATTPANKTAMDDNLNKLSRYISLNDLRTYSGLIAFYEEYKNGFTQLENDQSLKAFKFDLKKAINIPVNSLSGVNSEHIRDKYQKLHRLLSGQSVIVSDKEINASKHPQGIPFCMDLVAKKLVLQGDLMVSSNPESAFCYASVILTLWNDFPDFGRLLLAHFYTLCPYLVPYYIPKQVGESDEEFYKKLGYQYNDGDVEKQDKFLKRMTGIIKLYFTIMIAKPRKGQNVHPYNLKYAWKWLASFLRLEPQLDITATALHVFLETLGFDMNVRYGKMFQKLLRLIIQVFLSKCKEVKCTGGAVTRLELLLINYGKTGKFDKPNGYMEYAYW